VGITPAEVKVPRNPIIIRRRSLLGFRRSAITLRRAYPTYENRKGFVRQ